MNQEVETFGVLWNIPEREETGNKNVEEVLLLIGFCLSTGLLPSACLLKKGEAAHRDSDANVTIKIKQSRHVRFSAFVPLPFPGVFSAMSSTTRSPSRLDIGRPRSNGSNSPLCIRQTHWKVMENSGIY